MVEFNYTKPVLGSFLASEEVRNNFEALARANELRPRPMAEVDDTYPMKVYVEQGKYATDSQTTKNWIPGDPSTFPTFVAPITNPRTDVLYISLGGALTILQGTEGTGLPPTYPADSVPIAEVTLVPGQTIITETDIIDVRPWYVISAAGFGINPAEEHFIVPGPPSTPLERTIFTLTGFTYAPGQDEINVYSGGIRQRLGVDYLETGTNEITFLVEQPEGATISVWRVGAASAHNLADLDDVDVATAEGVTDPDTNRTNVANRNNPFATLADVTGSIPFGVEHDLGTGIHGPRVNVDQTGNDRALNVEKSGTGAGFAVNVSNSGTDSALMITQVGDANAIEILQQGAGNAVDIIHNGLGSVRIVQNADSNAAEIVVNTTAASATGIHISRIVGASTREPMITLEDLTDPTSGNVTFKSDVLSFADGGTNTLRFLFNVATGEQTITQGGDNNRLTISKASSGIGDCINITNLGIGNGIHIQNQGNGRALSIQNLGTGPDLYIAGAPNSGVLDPLWGGPASNADTFHTHVTAEYLSDLADVSGDEASAFNDTSVKRGQPVSAANPFAALADVHALGAAVAFGTYVGNGTSQTITTQITDPVTGAPVSFQPDWVMLYNVSDSTRSGTYVASGAGANNGRFFTSTGNAAVTVVATGFSLNSGDARFNATGHNFVYIAIKGQS